MTKSHAGNGRPTEFNGLHLVAKPISEVPTVSLCLITKDEERFIERCIKSVEGLCEQVVVVDTGSTDQTVAIAEACGAEVHFFEWNDSFADARNESIKWATGDWILILDADGELARESHDVVRALVRKYLYPFTFSGKAINYQLDGREVTESIYRMLFPNHHGIHYVSAVHEQLTSAEAGVELVNLAADMFMHHYGYLSEVMEAKHKGAFYTRLINRQVSDHPEDFLTRFHAGSHFSTIGDMDRAEREFKWCLLALQEGRGLKNSEELWFPMTLASLAGVYERSARFDEAIAIARECLSYDANDIQGQYWLGRALSLSGEQDEAAEVLKRLIYESPKLPKSPLFSNNAMQTWLGRRVLGQNELNRGNDGDAWAELNLALQDSPKDQKTWILGSIAASKLGNFEEALRWFGVAAALEDPPETLAQAYLPLRAIAPNTAPVQAIIREALSLWPENPVLMTFLLDVLEANMAVIDVRALPTAGPTDTEKLDGVIESWPSWGEAIRAREALAS